MNLPRIIYKSIFLVLNDLLDYGLRWIHECPEYINSKVFLAILL